MNPNPNPNFPLKTLAGSSMHQMGEDANEASLAIEKAIEKVAATEPHPRDYLCMGGGAADQILAENRYKEALAEHKSNLGALQAMARFYLAKSTHCYEQNLAKS